MEAPWVTIIFIALLSPSVRNAIRKFLLNTWRFEKVDLPGGLQLSLDKENARKFQKEYAKEVETQVKAEFSKAARKHKIPSYHQKLVDECLVKLFDPTTAYEANKQGFRSTIHMPSVLDDENLFQILEYYPRRDIGTDTFGRCQSIRYGIIGKAWRSRQAQYDPKVSTKAADLVKDWGMTFKEAEVSGDKKGKAFLAVPIQDTSQRLLAVLFFDSQISRLFFDTDETKPFTDKDQDKLGTKVLEACEAIGLTAALEKMFDDMESIRAKYS